jgi:hypothetical protein
MRLGGTAKPSKHYSRLQAISNKILDRGFAGFAGPPLARILAASWGLASRRRLICYEDQP